MVDTSTFHDCCRAVVHAAQRTKPASDMQYAATYAEAGLSMTGNDEIRTQAMYILNNLRHWRGDEARSVKLKLRLIAESTINE